PDADGGGDGGVLRKAVPLRVIAVLEDGDHAGAADALGIVHRRLREPVFLELVHAVVRHLHQRGLVAELQATGGAGLDAGGLQPHRDAVHAERALRHLVGALRVPGNVEGAARLAQPAADAPLRIHVDDAVHVLDDRARRWTGLEAARV